MLDDRAASSPLVRLRGVSKTFGSYVAIHNLDLDILNGEFITLLGPSGSGKTTTLMMLAGFETPTSGGIEMEGRHIEKVPAHKRNIGVVFQNYALFPHMTVRQNLSFPLRVRRMSAPEIDRAVAEALETVHMSAMADRRPSQLSGGQQQRVALARAIIFKPKLIVLDEPLGALDKNLREHLQAELKALHRDLGTTMVFVTHDQSEALTMSDRVAVFNKGRIEQLGSPLDLYKRPATPFVASFIGENNLHDAQVVTQSGGQATIRFAGGAVLQVANTTEAGRHITFCIRPEALSIITDPAAPGQHLPAQVVDQIYLGDLIRVVLEVEGLGRLTLKAIAEQGALRQTGDRVHVRIPNDQCRLLTAATST